MSASVGDAVPKVIAAATMPKIARPISTLSTALSRGTTEPRALPNMSSSTNSATPMPMSSDVTSLVLGRES